MKIKDLIKQLQQFKKKYGPDIEVGCLTNIPERKPQFGFQDINVDFFQANNEQGPTKDMIGITLTENLQNAEISV